MGELIPTLCISEAESSCLDRLLHEDVEKVLIDEGVIERRLDVLAERILEEFRGRDFVVIVILKGGLRDASQAEVAGRGDRGLPKVD